MASPVTRAPRQSPLVLAALALVCGLAAGARAESVTETYPDGKLKARYGVDGEDRIHGTYTEYHPNGKVRFRAQYQRGARQGQYLEYFDSGKLKISVRYREGELHGEYEERDAKGRPRVLTTYDEGRIDGSYDVLDGDRVVSKQLWEKGVVRTVDGIRPYPKSEDHIRTKLEEIFATEQQPGAGKDTDAPLRHEALQWLMAFRFLCDVPHAGLELVESMNAHAQAGAKLCEKIDCLDHTPANPGWPKAEYEFAYVGTSRSNLARGCTIPESVTGYMDDSDARNIDRLGHRRWCLNPPLLKLGFGASGTFSAMFAHDASRKQVPDYDVVAFPPRGLHPVYYFKPHYAWSVSLHRRKFAKPEKQGVTVRLFRVTANYLKGERVKIDYFNVENGGYGIPYCVIFRPKDLEVAPGARYWVEISGLRNRKGEAAPVRYLVEFFEL